MAELSTRDQLLVLTVLGWALFVSAIIYGSMSVLLFIVAGFSLIVLSLASVAA